MTEIVASGSIPLLLFWAVKFSWRIYKENKALKSIGNKDVKKVSITKEGITVEK